MSQTDDNQGSEDDQVVQLIDAMIERALKRSEAPENKDTSQFTIHEDGKVSSHYIDQDGSILFTTTDVNGPPFPTSGRTIRMDIHTLVSFFESMRPRHRTIALPGSGSVAARNIVIAGMELAGHTPTFEESVQMSRSLTQLELFFQVWPTLEHLVLEYTYIMLRNKHLKHEQAADDATVLLGEYVSKDAWRMRVRKFAKDAGLPPVEQRKRGGD